MELLAFISHHPACESDVLDEAAHLLSAVVPRLLPEQAAAAQERGKAANLEEVIAKCLASK